MHDHSLQQRNIIPSKLEAIIMSKKQSSKLKHNTKFVQIREFPVFSKQIGKQEDHKSVYLLSIPFLTPGF